MKTTKQKRHIETPLTTPEQRDSELFPAVNGGLRSPSLLNEPFSDVVEEMGLGKRFS